MKTSRRIVVVVSRELRRLAAIAAERATLPESVRKQRPSFRPLSDAETETLLGVELLAALSDERRRA